MDILIEFAKGIGKFFINPLFYWAILLVILVGLKRIKYERLQFGAKVFDVFSEWNKTFVFSIVSGLIVTIFVLGSGIVLTYDMLILLSLVTILLSLTLSFSLLSATYTVGVTFFILLIAPLFVDVQSNPFLSDLSNAHYSFLAILLGMFLIIESFLLRTIKRNKTYPSLTLSDRGIWIGQHRVKRIAMIPFFTLVPTGLLTTIEPYWPYLSIGEDTFGLVLFPFVIGVDFIVRGKLPVQVAKEQATYVLMLGIIVLIIAAYSIFLPWLSIVAVIIAIIGKEFIQYRMKVKDRNKLAYFHPENEGLKILGIIPGSPADRLDIYVGETIVKVNGRKVNSDIDFYNALHNSGAYFKLDVLDDQNEVRFVQGARYEGDHHELGFLFAIKPYRIVKAK